MMRELDAALRRIHAQKPEATGGARKRPLHDTGSPAPARRPTPTPKSANARALNERAQEHHPRHRAVADRRGRLGIFLRQAGNAAAGADAAAANATERGRSRRRRRRSKRPRSARTRRRRSRANTDPRRRDRRIAARRHRYAAAARQHRSQRRPHRRSVARAISRNHRSQLAADRAAVAVGRARCLLRGVRLGGGLRREPGRARPGYGLEAGRQRRAQRRSSGHAHLRQRPGTDLQPHHLGRRPLSVQHQRPGAEQGRQPGHALSLRADLAPRHADRCSAITSCTKARSA